MFKKKYIGLILAIILLANFSVVFGNVKLLKPVTTGITNLSFSLSSITSLNENYSYFDFIVDYEIYNPNKNPITYTLPYCNLAFLINISISFENDTLEYYHPHYIGLCMIGEKTVYPGITKETSGCYITIKEQALTELPNGNYTIWIYLRDHPEVISNTTIMTITDDQTKIIYNSSQTLGLNLRLPSIIIMASIILISFGILNKKMKNKKK